MSCTLYNRIQYNGVWKIHVLTHLFSDIFTVPSMYIMKCYSQCTTIHIQHHIVKYKSQIQRTESGEREKEKLRTDSSPESSSQWNHISENFMKIDQYAWHYKEAFSQYEFQLMPILQSTKSSTDKSHIRFIQRKFFISNKPVSFEQFTDRRMTDKSPHFELQ